MKKMEMILTAAAAVVVGLVIGCVPQVRGAVREGAPAMIYQAPTVREGVTHIACIGDSITYGAGVLNAQNERIEEDTWPCILEEFFYGNAQLLNYGVCARTLLKEGDYPYTETNYYTLSKECGAEGYLILLGTNDSKKINWNRDAFTRELEEFTRSYMELPQKPEVVLITPPAVFVVEGQDAVQYDVDSKVLQEEIVPIVRQTAEKLGIRCFDLYRETENHPEWFTDGVHPNSEGNRAIADFLHRSIMG